mmetsp:Transcript_35339/g.75315  ORF Transcript_35339/g.75315 Transcript_35339/m.75315 type:complete len:158 (-) Transcript_35339:691-1164(-)
MNSHDVDPLSMIVATAVAGGGTWYRVVSYRFPPSSLTGSTWPTGRGTCSGSMREDERLLPPKALLRRLRLVEDPAGEAPGVRAAAGVLASLRLVRGDPPTAPLGSLGGVLRGDPGVVGSPPGVGPWYLENPGSPGTSAAAAGDTPKLSSPCHVGGDK